MKNVSFLSLYFPFGGFYHRIAPAETVETQDESGWIPGYFAEEFPWGAGRSGHFCGVINNALFFLGIAYPWLILGVPASKARIDGVGLVADGGCQGNWCWRLGDAITVKGCSPKQAEAHFVIHHLVTWHRGSASAGGRGLLYSWGALF